MEQLDLDLDDAPSPVTSKPVELILRWRFGWLTCTRPDLGINRCFFQSWETALVACRHEFESGKRVRIRC